MLGSGTDWEVRKLDWIHSVTDLYRRVQELLKSSIDAGDVSVNWVEMELTEEFVGTYRIPRLEITIGNEGVVFGRWAWSSWAPTAESIKGRARNRYSAAREVGRVGHSFGTCS